MSPSSEPTVACPGCSESISTTVLSCPHCRRLTHADELERLAADARAAWNKGDMRRERELWGRAVELLPEDTVQYNSIRARLNELDRVVTPQQSSGWGKASMGIGPALVLLLSKGKLLLLGLTKMGTLLTMLASLGVYWSMYGWAFALGIVLSIYIHEMGHMITIMRFGLPATAPMFIPGFGAFIRLHGLRLAPVPNARIGLAGPIYGLGAALTAFAFYLATHAKIWGVIANFGAMINLFNLIPVWQLDGSRGMASLTRGQRGVVLFAAGMLWLATSVPMLLLIAAASVYRLFTKDWAAEPDKQGLMQFAALLVMLAAVAVFAPVK